MMKKVFTLPNLALVPTSDLQLLVLRLIEYADVSTIPAIADELMRQDRGRDFDTFRDGMVDYAYRVFEGNGEGRPVRWKFAAQWLVQRFWIDLFGWTQVVTALTGNIRSEDELFEAQEEGMPAMATEPGPCMVTDDLTTGEWAVIDYSTRLMRRALPNEIPQPEPANG